MKLVLLLRSPSQVLSFSWGQMSAERVKTTRRARRNTFIMDGRYYEYLIINIKSKSHLSLTELQ